MNLLIALNIKTALYWMYQIIFLLNPIVGGITMADKILICKDCGREFVFTESEQAFYKEKGFENEPQRCPDCRRARKQQRNNR